jgi:hypothetical protein
VVWDIDTLSYIELPEEEEESVANGDGNKYENGEDDEDSDEY